MDWHNGWEKGDYFFQPEVFFTRDIWERTGGYLKLHLYWAMDWDFWLRCAMAGATVMRIPDLLGFSRVHKSQKTTSDELYLWQIDSILENTTIYSRSFSVTPSWHDQCEATWLVFVLSQQIGAILEKIAVLVRFEQWGVRPITLRQFKP